MTDRQDFALRIASLFIEADQKGVDITERAFRNLVDELREVLERISPVPRHHWPPEKALEILREERCLRAEGDAQDDLDDDT